MTEGAGGLPTRGSLNQEMRELIVEDSFDISRRGVAVLFEGSMDDMPPGVRLAVAIRRPDGRRFTSEASVEYVLRRRGTVDERCSLLIYRLTKAEAPPGSVVRILGNSEAHSLFRSR